MATYMRGIPRELDEAAMLDGASRWTIFWRVILPLTVPAQSTLAVFTFLGAWNDYWWPLISATRSDMFTLTVGLAAAQMNYAQTSGLGYLDGAGGVRVDPDLHRLHHLPEADRPRDGRHRGPMKRVPPALLAVLALGSCAKADHKMHLYLQRFFGECGAEYGGSIDVATAEGECGIITTLVNRFNAENPDVQIDVNVVAWPGYPQLTAQVAAGDPPDLVTMHEGVARLCVEGPRRTGRWLSAGGRHSPSDFTDAARAGVTMYGHVYGLPGTRTAACSTSTPRCSPRPG